MARSLTAIAATDSPRNKVLRGLRQAIRMGLYSEGERLPSETKLAEYFGVCRMTVRAALSELMREGLIAKPPNRGALVSHRRGGSPLLNRVVALITDLKEEPQPGLHTGQEIAMESGIVDALREQGLSLLRLHSTAEDGGMTELLQDRPLGVLVAWRRYDSPTRREALAALARHGLPSVAYGDDPVVGPLDHVTSDHEGGARELVRRLLVLGCRRILRVWTLPETVPWIRRHNAGYEAAMCEAGLPVLPAVFAEGIPERLAGSRSRFEQRVRHFAGHLVEHLRGEQRADAIMVATDCEVFPVATACRLFGLVPGRDVLMAGYDNYWETAFERQWEPSVPVATVEKHNHQIGEAMVRLLGERLEGRAPAERVVLRIPQAVVMVGAEGGPKP